ncbi:multicopper oxidase domain-containing protein [Bradyrhizobium sp. Tv2a-2]|uniref:multicopper oxidase family protein n=1 Tax=Bradyrhizobium sp. Tv2a-2 TaxID=113395 RepID=UPI001FD8E1AB|nr:multicopper oxidase domain-containing protein [Bradyrhizobium sp. Tv2a-2]
MSASLSPASPAQADQSLRLEAQLATIPLGPGQAPTTIWGLVPSISPLRLKGGQVEVTFRNRLPVAAVPDWRGIDGAALAEPLIARPAVPPGAEATFPLPLRRAGTFFADLRLLAAPGAPPSRPLPFIVEESVPIAVDRDEIVLIEDWRAGATASRPETAGEPLFTVNGQVLPDIPVRSGERLWLRFINGSQQQVFAVKIEGLEVRVIAMDSAPAEPFPARNSALVLAPGGRVDALIDATVPPGSVSQILLHDGQQARPIGRVVASGEASIRPSPLPLPPALPADGLPAQLDLKSALRAELALDGAEWVTPAGLSAAAAPAFKVRRDRVIVLALSNRVALATSFHFHGHHFRLLDRLDDGWKPFWLDTLVIEPGQTQRIAFAATFSGRWLIESTATRWGAPRLVRWYSVD